MMRALRQESEVGVLNRSVGLPQQLPSSLLKRSSFRRYWASLRQELALAESKSRETILSVIVL